MSRKNKNKDKAKNQQGQLKIKTVICSMTSGLLLALCLGLIPENIWPAELSEVFSAKAEMIALIAASMALAALMLSIENSNRFTAIFTSIPIGIVAWLAAFSAIDVKSPVIASYMIFCMVPLWTAIIGILAPQITKLNAGIYIFILGATMIILSFAIPNTDKIVLILIVLFNSIFGSALGVDIAFAIVLFMGIAGVLMVFISLFYGAALWTGKNMQWRVLDQPKRPGRNRRRRSR